MTVSDAVEVVTDDKRDLEAVQFREFGPWHAVEPDPRTFAATNRTLCGRDAIRACRMYASWREQVENHPCQRCLKVAGRLSHLAQCQACGALMGYPLLGDGLMPQHHTGQPFTNEWRACEGSRQPYYVRGLNRA